MNTEIINEVYIFLKRIKSVSKWINREECIKIAQIHFEGKQEHLNVLKKTEMNEFKVGQIIKVDGLLSQINHINTQDNYFDSGKTTWLYITSYMYEKEFSTSQITITDSSISIPTDEEIFMFKKPKQDPVISILAELTEIKSLLKQLLNK